MNNKWDGIERRSLLRRQAEAMLSGLMPDELTAQPYEVLLHELLVHKVELEMQNEELRNNHNAMEEARDRYLNLYEFAPIGYVTISREVLISEINLTGCTQLGIERNNLVNSLFASYVAPHDRDRWHRLFLNMMEDSEGEKHAFDMEMLCADGSIFHAHLDCLRWEVLEEPVVLRIAMTDISQLKQHEADLRIAATVFDSHKCMMVTDANVVLLRVNQAFAISTGYSTQEAVGQNPSFISSGRHEADFYAAMWESINLTGEWKGDIWNKRKSGEVYQEYVHITAVKNELGEVTNYISVSST